jgi:hypothetical protein
MPYAKVWGKDASLSFNTFQQRRPNLSGIAPALAPANVRYCPKADKLLQRRDCPLSAKSRLMHCNMIDAKRKTASAAVSPKSDQVF